MLFTMKLPTFSLVFLWAESVMRPDIVVEYAGDDIKTGKIAGGKKGENVVK